GTNGWSLIGARYGHTRDLVISFEIVLPTGEIIRVGDGGGPKVRHSSSGYQLKHLFMGHQGTLGVVTEATLELDRGPRRSSPPSSPTRTTWTRGGPPASWRAPAWRRWPAWCCSTKTRSTTCAGTTRRTSRNPSRFGRWWRALPTAMPTR